LAAKADRENLFPKVRTATTTPFQHSFFNTSLFNPCNNILLFLLFLLKLVKTGSMVEAR